MADAKGKPAPDGAGEWLPTTVPMLGRRRGRRGRRGRGASKKRLRAPGERRGGFRQSLAPTVEKSLPALRQKIFGSPAPFVAVLAQGLKILLEIGDQGLQGLKFGLDDAQAREERRVLPKRGRCRCVRHGRIMARKGYRSAKFRLLREAAERRPGRSKTSDRQGRSVGSSGSRGQVERSILSCSPINSRKHRRFSLSVASRRERSCSHAVAVVQARGEPAWAAIGMSCGVF